MYKIYKFHTHSNVEQIKYTYPNKINNQTNTNPKTKAKTKTNTKQKQNRNKNKTKKNFKVKNLN